MVGQDSSVVVKFFQPWCKFCKLIAADYDKLIDIYKEERGNVLIARVNCGESDELCYNYKIFGYPTIHYFPPKRTIAEGKIVGKQSLEQMKTWVDLMMKETVVTQQNNLESRQETVEEPKIVAEVISKKETSYLRTALLLVLASVFVAAIALIWRLVFSNLEGKQGLIV